MVEKAAAQLGLQYFTLADWRKERKFKYTAKLMCKVSKVSESGYYRWLKNRNKQTKRQLPLVKIKEILSEHPDNDNYGYDPIQIAQKIYII